MRKQILLIIFILSITPNFLFAENIINIGWIGPLSGNASVLGVDSAEVMRNEIARINSAAPADGVKFNLVVEDDQYQTAKTLTAYEKLVSKDKVKFIVVLTYSGLFAIAPKAQRDGVLLVDPLDCDENIATLPDNVFCIAKMTESLAHFMIDAALQRKQMPCGIVYFQGDAFPETLHRESQKYLKGINQEECLAEGFDANRDDFRSSLTKFKARGIKSLFLYGYDQLGLAMFQARSLGIDAQFYTVGTITSPGYQAAAKGTEDGTIVSIWTAPKTDPYQKYLIDFKSRNGREPYFDIATVPSYDVVHILNKFKDRQGALKDSNLNYELLKEHFLSLNNYEGLSGAITMAPDGVTRSMNQQSLQIFKAGKLVTLK